MHTIPYIDIPPLQKISGTVLLPGSKSISNRALLLAALCQESTTLCGVLDSDDTQVMLRALEQLGCKLKYIEQGNLARGIDITGLNLLSTHRNDDVPTSLFLGNAGTVMRPLTAVLALTEGNFVLSGVDRMHERPIGDLVDALCSLGCRIDYLGQAGYPPLQIHTPDLNWQKLAQPIQVKGNTSSQFLTAMLMALPLVAKHDIVIEVTGELISKPYIAITLQMLKDFGVHVKNENYQRFTIPANSQYTSPKTYHVEADASSCTYFIAAGAIAASKEAPLIIKGVDANSIQGDIRFIDAARTMGASIETHAHHLVVYRQNWPLQPITLNCNHIPDAAMTLAVMAMYAKGTTKLTDIASWRVKETDRINAMRNELTKLGAQVRTGEDFIEITPPAKDAWQTAPIKTYDDHRMAMCFSLAAFNQKALPIRLLDPACVNKTYPDFFDHFFQVTHTQDALIPVITIDGPTASGKGTLASQLAQLLGYHYLDSGLLYRITAYAAIQEGIPNTDTHALTQLASTLSITFKDGGAYYQGKDISQEVRAEKVGMFASKIASYPEIRKCLIHLQHSFRQIPGLIADGRDMGTVVFKDAALKVFLTADAKARADRRYKQLIEKGIPAKIEGLYADLQARDAQDMNRSIAPLKPATDARLLDNSTLSIEASIKQVLAWWQAVQDVSNKI